MVLETAGVMPHPYQAIGVMILYDTVQCLTPFYQMNVFGALRSISSVLT
jgi:hypothetical protein